MKSTCSSIGAALGCAIALLPQLAHGQSYPNRPIRMIVPYSPGGATDTPARIMAQKMSDALGYQVVVDNRPGAAGIIGTDTVAKAQPDGHTVLAIGTPLAILPHIHKKLPYDTFKELVPVMQFGSQPYALVVHPSLGVSSAKELIALARSQPGKIDYASSGNGGAQHLFGALFVSMAKINMMHIPYKGSGPATSDLLGGQVKVGFPGIAIALPHHKAGRLRVLGVTSAKRTVQAPDVPSIAEAALPGYDAVLWLGLMLPRGTPASIVSRLNSEVTKILQQPEVRTSFLSTGTDAIEGTPEAFAALIKTDYEKWGRVAREIKLEVQ